MSDEEIFNIIPGSWVPRTCLIVLGGVVQRDNCARGEPAHDSTQDAVRIPFEAIQASHAPRDQRHSGAGGSGCRAWADVANRWTKQCGSNAARVLDGALRGADVSHHLVGRLVGVQPLVREAVEPDGVACLVDLSYHFGV